MRRIGLAATALLLVLAACSSVGPTTTTSTGNGNVTVTGSGGNGIGSIGLGGKTQVPLVPQVPLVQGALVSFQACDNFLTYVKAHALDLVGPYGLEAYGDGGPWTIGAAVFEGAADFDSFAAAPTRAPASSRGSKDGAFSGTNNQEAGVDEPDLVKTDGKRIITLLDGKLTVIDVTREKPIVIGSLQLSPENGVRDMFLDGDTVVLLGSSWGFAQPFGAQTGIDFVGDAELAPGYFGGSPKVTITEVDISTQPEIGRTLELDGTYLSSRLIDGIARIVLTSGPTGFAWTYPEGNGLKAEREAVTANKLLIEQSTLENWVPYYVLSDAAGSVIEEGPAIRCDQAHRPEKFGGLNMLSVITIDMAAGLDILDSTGVLANGETVYSSTDALYIATNDWIDWRSLESGEIDEAELIDAARTQIHQFDISGAATTYVATGPVKGYLLNQFSMSEQNGDLRVATTTFPNWWGGSRKQESFVSVLRPEGTELKTIGSVGGLGEGEQIYSVRFMGDVGYVVTFRQVDPLYTLDLSNPRKPIVRGELKIPGYSSYLHPINDSLVIGIGQDATDQGSLRGTQVALFDVSDLDNPQRVAKIAFGQNTNSSAELDHRAFLQWKDTIVVPLTEYHWDDGKESFFTGAVGIRLGDDSLTEIARFSHPGADDWERGWNSTILRSLVIDDSLYTVSSHGLLKSDLETFAEQAWLEL